MADKVLANYQRYPRQYFSGSDVFLFFNNVFVDQIVSLEFDMMQQTQFIYGYASYTADAIAYGARMVTGRFRINYVENMYLYTVMGLIGYDKYDSSTAAAAVSNGKQMINSTNYTAAQIATMVRNGSLEKMSDIMNICEERIWGTDAPDGTINKKKSPFFTSNLRKSSVVENGFDIIISYGDKEFDIGSPTGEIPSTVKSINGVVLTGVRQVVQPSGEPIYEEYSFMAKDMDNTIQPKK